MLASLSAQPLPVANMTETMGSPSSSWCDGVQETWTCLWGMAARALPMRAHRSLFLPFPRCNQLLRPQASSKGLWSVTYSKSASTFSSASTKA